MDKVFIEELCVFATIGVYDWEKTIKQKLLLDLSMEWDNKPAAATDDLRHALNYAAISDAVTELVAERSYGLIETVAEEVAKLLLNQFGIAKVGITVRKPSAVANARSVGVSIERAQS